MKYIYSPSCTTTQSIIEAFGGISEVVTRVDFGIPDTNENIKTFRIPGDVCVLCLPNTELSKKNGQELARIFASIPNSVTHISLHNSQLSELSTENLVSALAAIPPNVTVLNLSKNNLETKSAEELACIFKAIPADITTLDLSQNGFWIKTAEELKMVFSTLSTYVTTLKLSRLYIQGYEHLIGDYLILPDLTPHIAAIPQSVTTLDLSDNQLCGQDIEQLAPAFAAMSPSVTALDIAGNYYDREGITWRGELLHVLTIIPNTITTLNVSDNRLGEDSVERLISAFLPIRDNLTLTHLSLSNNQLEKKSGKELAQIFSVMPANIKTLDLSHNGLGSKTAEELKLAFLALNSNITTLDLSGNFRTKTGRYKTAKELVDFFAIIPPHVTSLNLSQEDLTLILKSLSDESCDVLSVFQNMINTYNYISSLPEFQLGEDPDFLQAKNLFLTRLLDKFITNFNDDSAESLAFISELIEQIESIHDEEGELTRNILTGLTEPLAHIRMMFLRILEKSNLENKELRVFASKILLNQLVDGRREPVVLSTNQLRGLIAEQLGELEVQSFKKLPPSKNEQLVSDFLKHTFFNREGASQQKPDHLEQSSTSKKSSKS